MKSHVTVRLAGPGDDPLDDDALRSPVIYIGLFETRPTITEEEEDEGAYADTLDLADSLRDDHHQ